MSIKHMVGLLVLVAVIFFGTVFMFVYKTFAPNPVTQNTQDTNNLQNQNVGQNQNSATTTVLVQTPAEQMIIDDQNTEPLAYGGECALKKKAQVAGREYEKGSVLVTFYETMDFETAVKTVELLSPQLSLQVEDSFETRKNFRQNHWLEVLVPENSEFFTQCQLEGKEGVKRTSLNYLFALRQ